VLEAVEREAEEGCARLMETLPTTRKELAERREALLEQLVRLFDSRTLSNDQADNFRPEIAKALGKRIERIEE
jgi:malate synthase